MSQEGNSSVPNSAMPGIDWPAVPNHHGSALLSLLYQLQQSERWSADELRDWQFRQLRNLVAHAYQTVPYYRHRLDERGLSPRDVTTPEGWSRLPILTRREVQLAGELLHSTAVPRAHGRVGRSITSGSTGQPIHALRTELTDLMWQAISLRDHLWHGEDPSETLAVIRHTTDARAIAPDGKQTPDWGPAFRDVLTTGPAYSLGTESTTAEQAAWLARIQPGYLLTYPTVLRALTDYMPRNGLRLTRLRHVRTFGEVLEPVCRESCWDAWQTPVVDMYSSQEVGYLALQCPQSELYHAQAETVLLEVVDHADRPVSVGETGRVIVTPLHNFAMPLLRYEIGDYAQAGGECPCGRRLPTLRRILGRQRNMLALPDGSWRWPTFGDGARPEALPPLFQFQVVQRTLDEIELRVVRPAPFTSDEEADVRAYVRDTLRHAFQVTITYWDHIERGPTGKFEDFVSQVTR